MRILIPAQLAPYIRVRDGQVVYKKELPETLKADLEKFEQELHKILTQKAKQFEDPCFPPDGHDTVGP